MNDPIADVLELVNNALSMAARFEKLRVKYHLEEEEYAQILEEVAETYHAAAENSKKTKKGTENE